MLIIEKDPRHYGFAYGCGGCPIQNTLHDGCPANDGSRGIEVLFKKIATLPKQTYYYDKRPDHITMELKLINLNHNQT